MILVRPQQTFEPQEGKIYLEFRNSSGISVIHTPEYDFQPSRQRKTLDEFVKSFHNVTDGCAMYEATEQDVENLKDRGFRVNY